MEVILKGSAIPVTFVLCLSSIVLIVMLFPQGGSHLPVNHSEQDQRQEGEVHGGAELASLQPIHPPQPTSPAQLRPGHSGGGANNSPEKICCQREEKQERKREEAL